MKKTAVIVVLFAALSVNAQTNVYLNISDEELIRRIGVIPSLEENGSNTTANLSAFTNNAKTAVLSAGQADIGFVNHTISAAFTNAAYAITDLSAYVGTNVARVTLQFKGIAASTVSIRTNGDTNTVDDTSMNSVVIAAGSTADMTVNTDSSGRIEVKATGNTSMTLVAFIRRHVFN